jgi:hypothetical protein
MIHAAESGTAEGGHPLERARTILTDALTRGRRRIFGSVSPLRRPLRFTITSLLEESETPGSVQAPSVRYPIEAELDIYHLVQDVLLFNAGSGPVAIVIAENRDWLIGTVQLDALRDADRLAVALNCRLSLSGGSVALRRVEQGITVAFERPVNRIGPDRDSRESTR